MRAIVQRVSQATVKVNKKLISSIGRGICVLVGISSEDTDEDIEYIAQKLINIRIFNNEENQTQWSKSVKDLNFEILCVSQFTLHSKTKGNKLDFHHAMSSQNALTFYKKLIERLIKLYNVEKIKNGQFGAYMNVVIENDGPVTIIIDSKNKK